MMTKKYPKFNLRRFAFGCFFAVISLFSLFLQPTAVYADEIDDNTAEVVTEVNVETEAVDGGAESTENTENTENTASVTSGVTGKKSCSEILGDIGWNVCGYVDKASEAVDWLYGKIKPILMINPVKAEEDSPIYSIWKYFLNVANTVFVIFLLVVVWSQITGLGINNYGIKKVLPKLIIAAVMVNLSFFICSLLVDVSNVIGHGLMHIFDGIATIGGSADVAAEADGISMAHYYNNLGGIIALGAGASLVAIETGAIWLLIPTALGGLVSVAVGLITIAMRQAVVILLIMVAPLACVAYMLPNTGEYFEKWKKLLTKMLVFYPMYSLLFGASALAGNAIIMSSTDGFGIILGLAVRIFPLFFSWSLMKMSGTFLGTINSKLTGLFQKPLAANRAWAESHRENTRQRFLAGNAYTPSLKLAQFLNDRKVAREEDTKENAEYVKKRGQYYHARRNYKFNKNGEEIGVTREGMRKYELQGNGMKYDEFINRNKNNMNKGLGQLEGVKAHADGVVKAKLLKLDELNMNNADALAAEVERGIKIDYMNDKGRRERFDDALNAHMDKKYADGRIEDGKEKTYTRHFDLDDDKDRKKYQESLNRYDKIKSIMEGNETDVQFIVGSATHKFDGTRKIYEARMQKLFEYTAPTQDIRCRLDEFTSQKVRDVDIDAVICGLRVLNQRGDTDLVKAHMNDMLRGNRMDLGTYQSQALANFLMFEVKDSDPFLRRFGKYINLETARLFNGQSGDGVKEMRKKRSFDYNEYLTGKIEGEEAAPKKAADALLEGTSLDGIERTAFDSFDKSLQDAYGGKTEGYWARREKIQKAMGPAFASAFLKWPSGSEQINSAIKFLTGYKVKQVGKDENNNPIYESVPTWDDEYSRKKYTESTKGFLSSQTALQALGMRSDIKDALMSHLVAMYFDDNKVSQEERNEYSDKEKEGFAKDAIRKIYGEKGTLRAIVDAKNTSSATSAKSWMRDLLGLNDTNDEMREMIKKYDKSAKDKKDVDSNSTNSVDNNNEVVDWIKQARDKNNDKKSFYEKTREHLASNPNYRAVVKEYDKYYNDRSSCDTDDLHKELLRLIKKLN